MSPATLQAKAFQPGSNLQQLLDDAARELTCGYLRQASGWATEETFMLGFADTGNFTRAFKRRTVCRRCSFGTNNP